MESLTSWRIPIPGQHRPRTQRKDAQFSAAIRSSNSMEDGPFPDLVLLPALSSYSCPRGSCAIRRVSERERDEPNCGGVSRLMTHQTKPK